MEDRVGTTREDNRVPDELPLLLVNDIVLYPYIVVPLAVNDEKWAKLIDEAAANKQTIGLFLQRGETEKPEIESIEGIGTAVVVARMLRLPDGTVQVLLQGLQRIRLEEITQVEPSLRGRVTVIDDKVETNLELEGLVRNLTGLFQRVVSLSPNLPDELSIAVANIQHAGRLVDFIAANSNLSVQERQELLNTIDISERLHKMTEYANRELEILEIGRKIQTQIKDEMDKSQREYYLREQLKAIQKELGEEDDKGREIDELRENIKKANMPPEALKEAQRELDRLATMSPAAADYGMVKTYLDWMVSLPWSLSTTDDINVGQAQEILDEDHYDLEKVKERIVDYLAVRKLKEDIRGPILCFVGPPGVGKTSLGQSIARAMGRKFVRMSLGGMRDEAELRGHRRTYIGALPGRIIQAIRRAETNNPVFMLDEVDKLGADFRGDPSSALLEVLDPAQNNSFVDHYLGVPFDLSKVMFIATANVLDQVPPPLRDRMEVLGLAGYVDSDKLEIAKRYLVKRQLDEHGLKPEQLQITDAALMKVIDEYTREAGVRNLEREIGTICRKVARRVAQGETDPVVVDAGTVPDYLGRTRFRHELAGTRDEIGVATGLAVTGLGGDVLFIEASVIPGRGNLILTGQLGEVMQESARAGITYVRSRAEALGIEDHFYEKYDIHIHVPAGAIPKDGPSAGITMATAVISALTRRPVRRDVAMTGEITLRGKVMPIGGVKEKVLAAHRAGIRTVILPKDNENDAEDIPAVVREDLKIHFAEHMDEVVNIALEPRVVEEKIEITAVP